MLLPSASGRRNVSGSWRARRKSGKNCKNSLRIRKSSTGLKRPRLRIYDAQRQKSCKVSC